MRVQFPPLLLVSFFPLFFSFLTASVRSIVISSCCLFFSFWSLSFLSLGRFHFAVWSLSFLSLGCFHLFRFGRFHFCCFLVAFDLVALIFVAFIFFGSLHYTPRLPYFPALSTARKPLCAHTLPLFPRARPAGWEATGADWEN